MEKSVYFQEKGILFLLCFLTHSGLKEREKEREREREKERERERRKERLILAAPAYLEAIHSYAHSRYRKAYTHMHASQRVTLFTW